MFNTKLRTKKAQQIHYTWERFQYKLLMLQKIADPRKRILALERLKKEFPGCVPAIQMNIAEAESELSADKR